MVYIRAKKIKSDDYLYIVKSVWDSKKNTSRQEIVKYLGKASQVVIEDVPLEYRNDPKIVSALSAYDPDDVVKREKIIVKTKQLLYNELTNGNINSVLKIYNQYTAEFSIASFFDKIFKLVIQKTGKDWEENTIDNATQHVASNIAQTLMKIIIEQTSGAGNKKKILLCVPAGEEHHLGCDVLEIYLTTKGFKVYNISKPLTIEALLGFIQNNNPDIIFVSITLEDSILAGQRLVKKIKALTNIPILVGGFALQSKKHHKFEAKVISDVTLEELPRIIKTMGTQKHSMNILA